MCGTEFKLPALIQWLAGCLTDWKRESSACVCVCVRCTNKDNITTLPLRHITHYMFCAPFQSECVACDCLRQSTASQKRMKNPNKNIYNVFGGNWREATKRTHTLTSNVLSLVSVHMLQFTLLVISQHSHTHTLRCHHEFSNAWVLSVASISMRCLFFKWTSAQLAARAVDIYVWMGSTGTDIRVKWRTIAVTEASVAVVTAAAAIVIYEYNWF